MNRKLLLLTCFLTFSAFYGRAACAALQEVPSASLVDPQTAEKANAHEEEAYSAAKEALDNDDYDHAIKAFDEVVKMHGRRADGALYFKAYALNKTGNKSQALATIGDLRKEYPKSTWLKDAGALEVEMKGAAVNPETILNDDDKMLAFTAIMNSNPDKGIAFANTWLHGNAAPKLKEKVLFVLATSGSEKAQETLLSIARTAGDPDLQKRAIRYIGMSGNSRSRAALKEIYNSATDATVKKSIFQGWLMCGCKDEVLAVARTERAPELRREAIRYLGLMGGRNELREMYKGATDPETREAVIGAMMLCGDSQGLADIAATEKDPNVLEKAINTLGLVGGQESLTALTNIYNSHNDPPTKKRVINALFLHGAAKEMVALARKETNPELKKAWLQKLSLMSSPEITEYMMEILNK